jgi:hypothetical protein
MQRSKLSKISIISLTAATSLALPASLAHAEQDAKSQILGLTQAYLDDQVNSVTESVAANRFAGTNKLPNEKVAGALTSTLAQERPRIQRLRNTLRGTPDEFDRGIAKMVDPELNILGDKATLKVTESTDLHYARHDSKTAQYTSYKAVHDLTFDAVSGVWKITSDNLESPSGAIEPMPYERKPLRDPSGEPSGKVMPGAIPASPPSKNSTPQATPNSVSATYDRSNVVGYAKQYVFNYNTRYASYGSDCTNFVSQAVNVGGWGMEGSSTDGSDQWYAKFIPSTTILYGNKSWINAQQFWDYGFNHSHRLRNYVDETTVEGNLIIFDWDLASGALGHDGVADHIAIVTQTGWYWTDILLTYHTNNTLNISLSAVRAKQANGDDQNKIAFYFYDPSRI